MKYKTTRKAVVNGTASDDLICAGYCEFSSLLRNHEPIAYTCGVYGWNFDVYHVYGKTICTGYRGMPGRQPNNGEKYEKAARALLEDYSMDWRERDDKIEELLREFCEQA